jgi:hypothetical protein
VFTKRDRTARLLGVANLLFQHPNGLTQHVHATVAWLNDRPPDDTRTRIFDVIATAWPKAARANRSLPVPS